MLISMLQCHSRVHLYNCDIHFVNWETHRYKVGKHSVRNVIVTTIMSSHVGVGKVI